MSLILPLEEIKGKDKEQVAGKAFSLAIHSQKGMDVPEALCVRAEAYLSSGIVERRGGLLIHRAIIAREYGLPCVTGIPEATTQIQTGEPVTGEGYLGMVTIG